MPGNDGAASLVKIAQDCGKALADALKALADEMPPRGIQTLLADLGALCCAVTHVMGALQRKRSGPSSRHRIFS